MDETELNLLTNRIQSELRDLASRDSNFSAASINVQAESGIVKTEMSAYAGNSETLIERFQAMGLDEIEVSADTDRGGFFVVEAKGDPEVVQEKLEFGAGVFGPGM